MSDISRRFDEVFGPRKGGAGSGNFGHAGRPGEVGGSGEGGGGSDVIDVGSSSAMDRPSKWSDPSVVERTVADLAVATIENVKAGKIPLVKLGDTSKFSPSTVAQYNEGTVTVLPRFFESDEFGRRVTMWHEFGHEVSSRALSGDTASKRAMEVLEPFRTRGEGVRAMFGFGNQNPEEFLADAYSTMMMASTRAHAFQEEQGKYPELFKYTLSVAKKAGLPTPSWWNKSSAV